MNVSDLNQWIQLGTSVFIFITFCTRVMKKWASGHPLPQVLRSNWALSGVVLIAVGFSCFTWYVGHKDVTFRYRNVDHLDEIHDHTYINETVDLDGKSYRHCKFQNVSFRWQGRAQFEVEDNEIVAPVRLISTNPAVLGAWSIMSGLGLVQHSQALNPDGSPAINIQPPRHAPDVAR